MLNKLEKGKKITLLYIHNFGKVHSVQTKFEEMQVKENHLQKFTYLIHKPKYKRSLYMQEVKNMIVLNGWIDIDTDKINYKIYENNGYKIKECYHPAFDTTPLKDIEIIFHKDVIYSNVK